MKDEILKKIYASEQYLEYLRRHPKWYYYLDLDPKYFNDFERVVKKAYKLTTYDKLEQVKNQINFASAMVKYFSNR